MPPMPPVTSTTRCLRHVFISCWLVIVEALRRVRPPAPRPCRRRCTARPGPCLASRRCISCSSVTRMRQPEAPIGWPIAMAPPLTLTFAGVPAHLLVDRAGLRGEGLVDLHQVEVGGVPAGACCRQRFATPAPGPCPCSPGRARRWRRLAIRASGLRPSAAAFFAVITTTAGRAVVQARGVAGRHAAGLVERRAQAGQRVGAGLPVDELVGGEHDRVALLLRRC